MEPCTHAPQTERCFCCNAPVCCRECAARLRCQRCDFLLCAGCRLNGVCCATDPDFDVAHINYKPNAHAPFFFWDLTANLPIPANSVHTCSVELCTGRVVMIQGKVQNGARRCFTCKLRYCGAHVPEVKVACCAVGRCNRCRGPCYYCGKIRE